MILYLRFCFFLTISFFKKKIPTMSRSEVTLRVWPWDCDPRNLNGARFYSFMDIAQHENNMRTGFLSYAFKNKIYVVARSSKVTFFKPLRRLKKCRVTAEVISWDEKYFYWENHFYNAKNELAATGYSQVSVRNKNGRVNPLKVIEEMGHAKPPARKSSEIPIE